MKVASAEVFKKNTLKMDVVSNKKEVQKIEKKIEVKTEAIKKVEVKEVRSGSSSSSESQIS